MASNHRTRSPQNPLLSSRPISHPIGHREAILNCSAVLSMISDFFGGNSFEIDGYSMLSDKSSRYGVWLMLTGIADTLDIAASAEKNSEHYQDITIPFSLEEIDNLQKIASLRDSSMAETAAFLVKRTLTDCKLYGSECSKEAAQ